MLSIDPCAFFQCVFRRAFSVWLYTRNRDTENVALFHIPISDDFEVSFLTCTCVRNDRIRRSAIKKKKKFNKFILHDWNFLEKKKCI